MSVSISICQFMSVYVSICPCMSVYVSISMSVSIILMLLHTHLQLNTTLIRRASRRSLATFQRKRRSFESQTATARTVISLSTLHAKCIKAPNTVTLPKVHGTQPFQCSRQNSAFLQYRSAHHLTNTLLFLQPTFKRATSWTARGSNPGGGEIFRTCSERPWGPPSLL